MESNEILSTGDLPLILKDNRNKIKIKNKIFNVKKETNNNFTSTEEINLDSHIKIIMPKLENRFIKNYASKKGKTINNKRVEEIQKICRKLYSFSEKKYKINIKDPLNKEDIKEKVNEKEEKDIEKLLIEKSKETANNLSTKFFLKNSNTKINYLNMKTSGSTIPNKKSRNHLIKNNNILYVSLTPSNQANCSKYLRQKLFNKDMSNNEFKETDINIKKNISSNKEIDVSNVYHQFRRDDSDNNFIDCFEKNNKVTSPGNYSSKSIFSPKYNNSGYNENVVRKHNNNKIIKNSTNFYNNNNRLPSYQDINYNSYKKKDFIPTNNFSNLFHFYDCSQTFSRDIPHLERAEFYIYNLYKKSKVKKKKLFKI